MQRFLRFSDLGFVIAFAVWISKPFLWAQPWSVRPAGGDYTVSVQGRFFWDRVQECGLCALWNGNIRGGSPALIDTSSDFLHPIAAIPTILLGVVDGSRISIVACVMLSALGSWWLASVLGTGWLARSYAGCLGAAGGHLLGRLDFGLVVLMTSIATASLLVPASITFARRLDRRRTAVLGSLLGATVISGQAYVQVGVVLLAPLILILFAQRRHIWRLATLRLLQVATLAFFLASLVLLPTMHYYHLIGKDLDPYFSRAQPFQFVLRNLVIGDRSYFESPTFRGDQGFPAWYSNYIGWVAIVFAIIGVASLWRQSRHEALFLVTTTLGALWLGSSALFIWISSVPALEPLHETVQQLRTASNIANLAVPPLIGLSACGVEWTKHRLDQRFRLRLTLKFPTTQIRPRLTIGLGLLVIVPVFASIDAVVESSQQWLRFEGNVSPSSELASALRSDELRWIELSNPDPAIILAGLENDLDLADAWRPWRIEPERLPDPAIVLSLDSDLAGFHRIPAPTDIAVLARDDGNPYARLQSANGDVVDCVARGLGGRISVTCPAGIAGELVVQQRYVDGWTAETGSSLPVRDQDGWLTTTLDGSGQPVEFRYRSPYFRSSLALTAAGTLWALWWICFPELLDSRSITQWRARFRPERLLS